MSDQIRLRVRVSDLSILSECPPAHARVPPLSDGLLSAPERACWVPRSTISSALSRASSRSACATHPRACSASSSSSTTTERCKPWRRLMATSSICRKGRAVRGLRLPSPGTRAAAAAAEEEEEVEGGMGGAAPARRGAEKARGVTKSHVLQTKSTSTLFTRAARLAPRAAYPQQGANSVGELSRLNAPAPAPFLR